MALDNDEENMDTIQRLLAEIKREKQVIRDEVIDLVTLING